MKRLWTLALAAALTVAGAPPAFADKEEGYVDLYVQASFDRKAYTDGETVRLDMTITNEGTASATGVVVRSSGDMEFGPWNEYDESGPGVELAPGEQVRVSVMATTNANGEDMTQKVEAVSVEPDLNPADNSAVLEAFIAYKVCDLFVTVYGDVDQDGVADPGEGRAGILVKLSGGIKNESFEARTDSSGVAHFLRISGGVYNPTVTLPKGWYIDLSQVIEVRSREQHAEIRAVVNDFSKLSASVSFDRDTYAPTDSLKVRVTLTNSGTEDIVGIYAYCGMFSIEETNILTSNGWDELSTIVGGPGAVVRAGETRRWEFDDVVPPMAWSYGFVRVLCDFSPSSAHDGPIAEARAAVPGGRGTVAGTLTTEDRRTPLPGVQVVLIHTVTNLPVVSAVADGAGRFQFPELPADLYELRPVGPWTMEGTVLEVQIRAGVHHDFNPLILLPGPTWLGPDATPPPTTLEASTVDVTVVDEPAPQASPRPANLADTGADVVELVAIGFLLVLAGAGLLFVRRRPTS